MKTKQQSMPTDQHITYQFQYRKCGKERCSTCHQGPGHGPYWYAYWRDAKTHKLRSGYIGQTPPATMSAYEREARERKAQQEYQRYDKVSA